MSTLAAVLTIYAVLSVSACGTYVLIRHATGRESTRDRIIREAHEPAGPDALRLLEDLDTHLDTYSASVRGFYDDSLLALTGPELDASCDRLRAALRDEQRKGEQ